MKIFITIREKTVSIKYNPKGAKNQISSRGDLDNVGVCRVSYRPEEYNEFEFDGRADFLRKFAPCVEKDLLRFMGVLRETDSKSPGRK